MNAKTLADEIQKFLDLGRAYYRAYHVEQIQLAVLNSTPKHIDPTPQFGKFLDSQRETNGKRNPLVAAGRKLARTLETIGEDSRQLLAFVQAVDGLGCGQASGGPAYSRPLWDSLAVELQRLAIREQSPPAATSTPGTDESEGAAATPPAPGNAGKLESLASTIPAIDEGSTDWISNKQCANLLGVEIKTLANHRDKGEKMAKGNESCGLHDGFCFWRKIGNAHPRYYAPLLKENARHLVGIFPKTTLADAE